MNILTTSTPAGILERTEYANYAQAKKAYDEGKEARTSGPASLIWVREGLVYRRFRLDADFEGEREVVFKRREGRPPKYGEKTRRVCWNIPASVYAKIEAQAEAEGIDVSEAVVRRLT